ncbi:MAG TPA: hypothetical protein VGE52_04450 [Pirellulales bacterium]
MTIESPSRPRGGPPPLSPTLRMALSFVLIVHLVAVSAAIAGKAGNSAADRVRRKLFEPYLQTLFMDTAYRYSHTNALEGDVGYILASEVELKDGTKKELILNDHATSPPLRRQRWYGLTRMMADHAEPDQVQGMIAQSLARGLTTLWAEQGVTTDQIAKFSLQCRAHALLEPYEVEQKMNPNHPGRIETIYAADVVLRPGDAPIVNPRAAAGEVAPAAASHGATAPRGESTNAAAAQPASTAPASTNQVQP